jgi:hypothetical protein
MNHRTGTTAANAQSSGFWTVRRTLSDLSLTNGTVQVLLGRDTGSRTSRPTRPAPPRPQRGRQPDQLDSYFPTSDDRANGVTVELGAGGALSATHAAPTLGPTAHVIFDVTGNLVP